MEENNRDTQPLQFAFTADGFVPVAIVEHLSPADREQMVEFEKDPYAALYRMGLQQKKNGASASSIFLTLLTDSFFKQLTSLPDIELLRENAHIELTPGHREMLLGAVPFALGAEYVTESWLENQFSNLNAVFSREIKTYAGTVALYLAERSQNLHVPERIFFHLVESGDSVYPFAFLATYATRDEAGTVRHVPLQYALTEYKTHREKLLDLLSCLNRAAEVSSLVAEFMESGEMFHTLRLTSDEAYIFLTQIEAIENAGIMCRIPNWWKKKSAFVSLSLRLGEEKPSMLGFQSLISVLPQLEVDGVALTEEDIRQLLSQTEGLAFLKGKWIAVDHAQLRALLADMENVPQNLTLMDALRMELGTEEMAVDITAQVTNGEWLGSLLRRLRQPSAIRSAVLPKSFHAQLRPYQKTGYTWLRYMSDLGFGACLADDMGLGKTIQVLAFLEKLRNTEKDACALLIVPASLLGNWEQEIGKFAPDMDYCILHGKPSSVLAEELVSDQSFLTITTYGMAARLKVLQNYQWRCVILDEAQAIKNAMTKQSREIKKIPSEIRIAMTGTPIENDLTNLWSLFDFLNKGLLGTSDEFKEYCKKLTEHPEGYAQLKAIVSPFLLRRLKTDKSIISDLPDKLEMHDYVNLTKRQIVLYRKAVADMEEKIESAEGIARSGIVLNTILRLKQICNHPDQYLGQDAFAEEDSGKLQMLREICETIRDKHERVLVFTQFREITDALSRYLTGIFGVPGRVLHGGTPVPKRKEIVDAFQSEEYVPYLVLSVKAGGTGLNLTKAAHVIHFDRWWNPAVENQATDRAYRIGQTERVMVHKLVCRGTVEEKIDAMIASKKELAENVIGSGAEKWITQMSNDELMQLLRLEVR